MKNNVNIQEVVNLLNEALALDYDAISKLVENRVSCNKAIADHPTIQVRYDRGTKTGGGAYLVGMLGMINGLFDADSEGNGSIVAVYGDDNGEVNHFGNKIIRFGLYEDEINKVANITAP